MADSAPLWFSLGQARRAGDDLPGSFDAFARSFELAPGDAAEGRAAVQVAFLAAQGVEGEEGGGWYARGGGVADRLAALDDGADARVTAGEAWLSAKGFGRARSWFEQAAAKEPASVARFLPGPMRRRPGEAQRVARALRRRSAKGADAQLRRGVQWQRGYALQKLGDYSGAAAAFRAAGDEDSAKEAEAGAAAVVQNRQFHSLQEECRARVRKLVAGRDDLVCDRRQARRRGGRAQAGGGPQGVRALPRLTRARSPPGPSGGLGVRS